MCWFVLTIFLEFLQNVTAHQNASLNDTIKINDFLQEKKEPKNLNSTSFNSSLSGNEAQRDKFPSSTTLQTTTTLESSTVTTDLYYYTEKDMTTEVPQTSTQSSTPKFVTQMTSLSSPSKTPKTENTFVQVATTEGVPTKTHFPTLNGAIIAAVTFTAFLNLLNLAQYIYYYLCCKRSNSRRNNVEIGNTSRNPLFEMRVFD